MGVNGLTGLVDTNASVLFEYFRLRDCRVVIDGSSLLHGLYLRGKVDFRFGGDYPKYARVIRKFFELLKRCSVTAVVLIDGSLDPLNVKAKTHLNRLHARLCAAKEISGGGTAQLCPMFAQDVFVRVLLDAGVELYKCPGEADQCIATLANAMQCPVMSQDSDFYIFAIDKGYIPLDSVEFLAPSSDDYIPARIFYQKNLLECFPSLKCSLMPVFSALVGNDYVPKSIFSLFTSTLPKTDEVKKLGNKRGVQTTKKQLYMLQIFDWLSEFDTVEEAEEGILNRVAVSEREKLRNAVRLSLKQYDCHKDGFSLEALNNADLEKYALPAWCIESHFRSIFPSILVGIRTGKVAVLLQPQVEDFGQDSIYLCSAHLRTVVYTILLREINPDAEVQEYMSDSGKIGRRRVKLLLSEDATLPVFSTVADLGETQRADTLCRLVGVEREWLSRNFEPSYRLFAASAVYWVKNDETEVPRSHFLALCFVVWYLKQQQNSGSELTNEMQALDVTPRSVVPTSRSRRKNHRTTCEKRIGLCLRTLHCYCQWQTCLWVLTWLNAALKFPFDTPRLHHLLSGRLLYNLTTAIANANSPSDALKKVLSPCPNAWERFSEFYTPLEKALSDENFCSDWKMKKTIEKKRKIIKETFNLEPVDIEKETKDDVDSVEITEAKNVFQDAENRFSALLLL